MKRLYGALLSLCLLACGPGDSPGDSAADAGTSADAGQRTECNATVDYGNVGSLLTQTASGEGGASGRANIESRGILNSDTKPDALEALLFANNGPFGEWIDNTGTFPLTGKEASYATCGACVLLHTDLEGQMITDTYMARSGQLELLEVGTRFRAVITDAEFRHVTISQDTTTTDHADGCTTFVKRAEFDVAIIN